MQLTASRPANRLSDRALARHFVALAELTALEHDHRLSQHLLDVAYDLFSSETPSPQDEA